MPYYEYVSDHASGCSYCREPFTILQKLSEARMTRCPYCRHPVRQLISPPSLVGKHSAAPSAGEAEKAGFTQYRKIGKGVYEKSAGKGPDIISSD